MTVENVNFISDLDPVRPQGGDSIAQGDDHIRNIKKAIKQTFPNIDGEVLASDEEVNHLVGVTKPITEIINDTNKDVTDLEARVEVNEDDIASLKTDKADKTYVDAELAKKADITYVDNELSEGIKYVDEELAKKADTTYVDAEMAAVNAEVAKKADKTYVDGELAKKADKSELNAIANYDHWKLGVVGDPDEFEIGSKESLLIDPRYGISIDARVVSGFNRLFVSISQDLKDQIDGNEQGVSDNASDIATLQNLVSDLQAQVGNLGGGMITATQQPDAAGDFTVNGTDQTYRASVAVSNSITKTLQVPAGKVFCFEYLYGIGGGTLRVDIDQIYIDGVRMYPTNQDYFEYDQSGGSVWPGQDRGPLIRVKDKIEIKAMTNYNSTSTLYLAGFFTEA